MARSTLDMAGGKSQQFTILKIDTIFDFYKPKPPLSKFVDSFWLYEGRGAETETERILPTGTLELAINLRQNELRFYDPERPANRSRLSGAVVSGAHGSGFAPESAEEVIIIGVHFKPGGAFPFLGLPAGDLNDTHVDLETLWGRSAGRLRNRLCEAKPSAERFQQTRTFIQQNPSPNWTTLAVDRGYFDQSHFIREFLEFSGLSPTDYINRHKRFIEQNLHVKPNHRPHF